MTELQAPRRESAEHDSPKVIAWVALLVLYIVWGSNYLAIRIAVQTIPPLLMTGAHFLLAGALLYPVAVRCGDHEADRPGARQWGVAIVSGLLLLVGGSGLVGWAEQRVPSGITALLAAMVCVWLVVLERLIIRKRPRPPVVAGVVIGLGGVALLVVPTNAQHLDLIRVTAILFATLAWAAGSLYSRQSPLPARPLVSAGMQMITGGVALVVVAAITGEVARLRLAEISTGSAAAFAWLVVSGGLGFGAYTYVLRHLPAATVGTYAFVTPVVALLLGAVVLGETLTGQTLCAGGVIVAAVVLIVRSR